MPFAMMLQAAGRSRVYRLTGILCGVGSCEASQALLFASTVLLGAKCVEITGQLRPASYSHEL